MCVCVYVRAIASKSPDTVSRSPILELTSIDCIGELDITAQSVCV